MGNQVKVNLLCGKDTTMIAAKHAKYPIKVLRIEETATAWLNHDS